MRTTQANGLCRKIAFSRQNPKIVYWKINDLRVRIFLFSVICDRALLLADASPDGPVRADAEMEEALGVGGLTAPPRQP